MSKSYSTYLDIIRFVAALLVLLYHSNTNFITTDKIFLSNYGHSAVIVFFVLSGFVIAYITDTKEHNIRDYVLSRMARMYSVALPIVLITPFLDLAGEYYNPEVYAKSGALDYWYIRVASSLLFLNEIWFFSIMSFSNTPYWSLCYEVWYYVIFAGLTFMRGEKRLIVVSLVCLFVGPKILLLFPLWYLGVVLYRNNALNRINWQTGLLIWLVSLVLIVLFHRYNLQWLFANFLRDTGGEWLYKYLTFSKFFLSDYILAPLIAANFIGAKACVDKAKWLLEKIRPSVIYVSSFTFILYLAHQPLLNFFSAYMYTQPKEDWHFYKVMVAVFISVWLIGSFTESKKKQWRTFFLGVFIKVETQKAKWPQLFG